MGDLQPIEQRVYIVADDRYLLKGLAHPLRATGLNVHWYTRADAFLEQFDQERSGCVILAFAIADMDGLELQQRLQAQRICSPIIFITDRGDVAKAVVALKNGALDVLENPVTEPALLKSVDQALAQDAAERRLARDRALVAQRFANLTPREQQVYALVVADLPNKEIARRLKISPRTVEHHREHVMLKMQAHSVTELVTMAILCGIHQLQL